MGEKLKVLIFLTWDGVQIYFSHSKKMILVFFFLISELYFFRAVLDSLKNCAESPYTL